MIPESMPTQSSGLTVDLPNSVQSTMIATSVIRDDTLTQDASSPMVTTSVPYSKPASSSILSSPSSSQSLLSDSGFTLTLQPLSSLLVDPTSTRRSVATSPVQSSVRMPTPTVTEEGVFLCVCVLLQCFEYTLAYTVKDMYTLHTGGTVHTICTSIIQYVHTIYYTLHSAYNTYCTYILYEVHRETTGHTVHTSSYSTFATHNAYSTHSMYQYCIGSTQCLQYICMYVHYLIHSTYVYLICW